MFRFTIRDVLWLMVVVGLSVGWWLDRRLEFASRREFVDSFQGNVGRLVQEGRAKEVQQYLRYHCRPEWDGQRQILVVSWFHEHYILFYRVGESGHCFDARETVMATQACSEKRLSRDKLQALRHLMDKLPGSYAEPPTEQTVLVSFQLGDKWRTETYDAAGLPNEFEKVMLIIGERFETKDRHKKK
jgi:hypothetical protein